MDKQTTKRRSGYMTGLLVGLALAGLTIVEFIVAINYPSATLLLLIGLVKASLVVYFFMHVYRLWRPEGSH